MVFLVVGNLVALTFFVLLDRFDVDLDAEEDAAGDAVGDVEDAEGVAEAFVEGVEGAEGAEDVAEYVVAHVDVEEDVAVGVADDVVVVQS